MWRCMRHFVSHLFGVPDSSARPELDMAEIAVTGLGGTVVGLEPRANFPEGTFTPPSSAPSRVKVSSAVIVLLHFPSDIGVIGFVLSKIELK